MRGPKSHGNGVIDQKKFIVRGHEAKKKLPYRRKKYLVWEGLERETCTIDRYRPVATPQYP